MMMELTTIEKLIIKSALVQSKIALDKRSPSSVLEEVTFRQTKIALDDLIYKFQ